ncbi:ABC transporter substrate-binding protein [Mesorhizobium sp. KR9-304]|uniref:ABC transporter substrate-binding protein n=1 Tax=Mesorhizobium sp. KR9-304 TaxID=3156614 RepID=UPI0032B46497
MTFHWTFFVRSAFAVLLASLFSWSSTQQGFGQSGIGGDPGTAGPPGIEVIHWWTSGGEKAAVSVFQTEFDRLGPNKWIDSPVVDGAEAMKTIFARVRGGNPPGAAQFNISRQFDQLIKEERLLDLTPLAKKERWRRIIRPKSVLGACERNGHIWCVPVNIHSWQWAWVSLPVLQKSGVPVPRDMDEFLAAAPKIKEAGYIPFALGGEPWQEYGLFGVLMLNMAGRDVHYKLYKNRNTAVARSQKVARVFEAFRALRVYSDKSAKGRSWSKTTDLVINDKAALQIMADWARGEFAQAGKTPGVDYECIPGPSENPYFQVGGDVFIFPKQSDPEIEKAQLKLASMMLNPRVQTLFNMAKGSLPVRDDVDLSLADSCVKKGLNILKRRGSVVENNELFLSGSTVNKIQILLDKFLWDDSISVEAAQNSFAKILASDR